MKPQRFIPAISLHRSRQWATQMALFAMLLQAMLPLSALVPIPGEAGLRGERSIPNFYLVICTAFGAQVQDTASGEPLDKVPTDSAPWDCPVCLMQTSIQGLAPVTPQVAFTPHLPRGSSVPAASETRTALWSAAPGLARAPPLA